MCPKRKPPLPIFSLEERRPEIFCLDFKTQRDCDVFNREQDKHNRKIEKEFNRALDAWKKSKKKKSKKKKSKK